MPTNNLSVPGIVGIAILVILVLAIIVRNIYVVQQLGAGLFGGEGLFNTVLTGPGRIWLQTMPISGVAAALLPYIPTGNN